MKKGKIARRTVRTLSSPVSIEARPVAVGDATVVEPLAVRECILVVVSGRVNLRNRSPVESFFGKVVTSVEFLEIVIQNPIENLDYCDRDNRFSQVERWGRTISSSDTLRIAGHPWRDFRGEGEFPCWVRGFP
jgi:hypothetical protein